MNEIIERLDSAVKNWWVSLLLGVLYIGLAIWLLMYPGVTYETLSIVFSVCILMTGIFEIAFSLSNTKMPNWGWYLAGGIMDLIVGVMLMSYPGLSEAVLPMILAFWLMFRGFTGIGLSFDAKSFGSKNWGWLLFISILAILCSIGIIWMPAVGAMTYVVVTAMAFFVAGFYRIALSMDLKGLKGKRDKVKDFIKNNA